MEVKLRPSVNGCLMALLAVMTLGMSPLLMRIGERHFIRRMNDDGIETRSGKRIAWGEFTCITHKVATMRGTMLSDEYLLQSAKSKVTLPLWRVGNAKDVLDYMLERLPSNIKVG
jgi:hypothetical protein